MSKPGASVTIDDMIAELLSCLVKLPMNDWSIFILSNGNAVRQLSDEYPVPKSSSDSETPMPLSFCMNAWFSTARSSSTDSVSSISSRSGGKPEFFNADWITSNKSACLNWTDDRLTANLMPAGHDVAASQARLSTHSPSGTISPVSSASGMNWSGGTSPRVG